LIGSDHGDLTLKCYKIDRFRSDMLLL